EGVADVRCFCGPFGVGYVLSSLYGFAAVVVRCGPGYYPSPLRGSGGRRRPLALHVRVRVAVRVLVLVALALVRVRVGVHVRACAGVRVRQVAALAQGHLVVNALDHLEVLLYDGERARGERL